MAWDRLVIFILNSMLVNLSLLVSRCILLTLISTSIIARILFQDHLRTMIKLRSMHVIFNTRYKVGWLVTHSVFLGNCSSLKVTLPVFPIVPGSRGLKLVALVLRPFKLIVCLGERGSEKLLGWATTRLLGWGRSSWPPIEIFLGIKAANWGALTYSLVKTIISICTTTWRLVNIWCFPWFITLSRWLLTTNTIMTSGLVQISECSWQWCFHI
jgi:hypothetical protein